MFMPPSRTSLLMKLMTTGAAIVSKVESDPNERPADWAMLLVTAFSEFPNNAGRRRLPADIKGELASVTLLAICDQDTVPEVPGTISRIFRSTPGSLDLLANPPRSAAMDGSIPREIACVGWPSALEISLIARLSTVLSTESNIELAILPSFSGLGEAPQLRYLCCFRIFGWRRGFP
jgi:hypothetical protein